MPFFRGGPKRAPRGGGMDRQDGLGARLASWPLARMASRAYPERLRDPVQSFRRRPPVSESAPTLVRRLFLLP